LPHVARTTPIDNPPDSEHRIGSSEIRRARKPGRPTRTRRQGSWRRADASHQADRQHPSATRSHRRSSRTPLAARIWTPPGCRARSREQNPHRIGCGRISGLSVEALILRAKMDIRAPRANRGAGFKSQGCYRPDEVSGRRWAICRIARPASPSRKSSSASNRGPLDREYVVANQPPPSRPPTSRSGPRRRPSSEGRSTPTIMPPREVRVSDQIPDRVSRRPRRSARVCWRRRSSLCYDLVASAP
jgi:hypothetical protein